MGSRLSVFRISISSVPWITSVFALSIDTPANNVHQCSFLALECQELIGKMMICGGSKTKSVSSGRQECTDAWWDVSG
jgi:hypothetical protein